MSDAAAPAPQDTTSDLAAASVPTENPPVESTEGTVDVEAKGAKALEPETTSAHEPDPAAARDLSEVGASFNRELVLTPGVKTTTAT